MSFILNAGFVGLLPSFNTLKAGAPAFPTTINLAPGLAVPIPTFPVLLDIILLPLSNQLILPPVTPPVAVGVCQVAFPSLSEVSTAPLTAPAVTCKLVILVRPFTSSLEAGAVVPIPTLPSSLTLKAGFVGVVPSCRIFKVGAPASPTTINLAPGAVVPTPTRPLSLTLKAGFIGLAPSCRIFKVGAPSSPTTINLAPGAVVPIPTRPFSLTLKAGFVGVVPSCNIFNVGAPASPTTINLAPGEVVPIPTRPLSLILRDGFIPEFKSLKIFKVGAPS